MSILVLLTIVMFQCLVWHEQTGEDVYLYVMLLCMVALSVGADVIGV